MTGKETSITAAMVGIVVLMTALSSSCLAFNTNSVMKPISTNKARITATTSRSSSTKLYDSYEDQYAKFYNRPVGNNNNNGSTENGASAPGTNGSVEEEASPVTEAAAAPSYLESMSNNNNANGANGSSNNDDAFAFVEEQSEQVYYEATNSYEAPSEPEPVVTAAAIPRPPSPPKQEPVMMAAQAQGVPPQQHQQIPKSDPLPPATPFGAPPQKFESTESLSSPTLSAAESSTTSVTLPLALPKLESGKVIPFGEASRVYRRTVYTHDDWIRHRSPDRFIRYVANIFNSGVYKNVGREVLVLTAVTAFVMVYNGSVMGYQDFYGLQQPPLFESNLLPPLTLPLTPFTLTSSSLGLLVAFRSNTAYSRWDEARKNWGKNINHTRDLIRKANAYYDRTGVSDEKRKADLERVALCTWAFVRSMKRHLSPEDEDEAQFKAELYERLPKTQAAKVIAAAHRPNRALYDLSLAIENLPMHFMRKNEMHASLTIFEDNLGSSERLLTSPVPLIYNRHTARFLLVWVLLLPFALWEPFGNMWNHIGLMPTMAMLGLMLFGIEELATQLEEPFTVLPMQAFCDKIGNWVNEISLWEDGTNGITTNRSYQGRTKV